MTAERPLIIIGAGRSGTNALRDALCTLPEFHTWPCDEINYVWRHGNRTHPTDELTPAHATPEVGEFIQSAFARQARRAPTATLVEKTCANSLRVGFVDSIFPQATLVHLVRDGRDVAASAMDRWTAPLDVPYLAAKARFVPPSDLPYYASRYLASRLAKLRSAEDRLSWWGPKFEGMEDLDASIPLVDVAARQWERCIMLALDQLEAIESDRIITLGYESLAADPLSELAKVVEHVGVRVSQDSLTAAAATIRSGSVGRWKELLSPADVERLAPILTPALERIGISQ